MADRTCKICGTKNNAQWRKISADDWACNPCWSTLRRNSRKKPEDVVPTTVATPAVVDPALATTPKDAELLAAAAATVVSKAKKVKKEKKEKVVKPAPPPVGDILRVDSLDGDKVCPKCKQTKPKSVFGLRTMKRRGGTVKVLQSQCPTCRAKKEEKI